MWSYYGSKNRLSSFYPKPKHHIIIEPFAGGAYYSLKHFENDVFLYDLSPKVISIWHYLQDASIKDIAGLPRLNAGDKIENIRFDCDGQKHLMSFLIVQAAYGGNNVVSKWGALRLGQNIKRVKDNLFKVKHWNIALGTYEAINNTAATWFIDPPYFQGGHKYPCSNRNINFKALAGYSKEREGQVIVCENSAAHWLPFIPFRETNGVYRKTQEVIWTNDNSYKTIQKQLF